MVTRRPHRLLSAGLPLFALALAACGGGGGGGVISTPAPAPTPAPTPTPTPTPTTNYNTAEYQRSNGAVQARAIAAYNAGATGAGITVGVIDSGVATGNAEFAGRISSLSTDLVASRGIDDEGGHGTAVAEVLLGARNNSGIHGIAFDATLLALRADTVGSCAMSTADEDKCSFSDNAIARGLDRAVSARARVVNISLGGTPANATLRAAVDRATAAGVIIVISGGNDFDTDPAGAANPDLLAQLARDPVGRGLILIAGATDATQTITGFSNRAGNSADVYLTALGSRVRSIDQTGTAFLFSGTSLATPLVSGAVALLAQAFPTLTPSQIVDLLLRTATDLGAPGTDPIYGRGELNLERAFAPQGTLTVAGQPIALSDNAVLGTAMGDAGSSATGRLLARIRDGYGRDYTLDLAPTIRAAARQMRLAPALSPGGTTLAAARGTSRFTLALGAAPFTDALSTAATAAPRRALAGSVVTALGGGRSVASGFAMGSGGLVGALNADREPPLLIAGRSDADTGFIRSAVGAFAVRQALGRVALTVAVEQGDLRLARDGDAFRGRLQRFGYGSSASRLDAAFGPVRLIAGATQLREDDTILGGRFAAGLGGGGAVSWFGDAGAAINTGGWRAAAIVRRGWTRLSAGPVRSASTLTTRAMSVDLARTWANGLLATLRWSEPLRVVRGGLDLTGYDTPARYDLAPRGHERDLEAGVAQAAAGGWLTANAYWRQQPGNDARARDDLGLALRYGVSF